MHTIMDCIGAVGSLMQETGLEEIMETGFGGVAKILSGKKYPQNMRALQIIVEELLHDFILQENIENYSQLMSELEDRASRSRTTKLWVSNLVKPVFLMMMMYVRAKRESDWPLYLLATINMMQYL